MQKNFANFTKETTTATDTSVLVLGGAVASYRAFIEKIAIGTTGIEIEVGPDVNGKRVVGAYTFTDATHMTRTAILDTSAGVETGVLAAGVKEATNIMSAERLASIYTTAEAAPLSALPSATPAGANLVPFSPDGGATLSYCTVSAILALGGAAPTEAITVTTPGAKTTGTAFSLTGGYTNGTPTALDYSLDGGNTWQAALSPVIGSGAYSFNVTLSTANAGQVINVRDHNNISVIGASGAFAVTGPAVQALTVTTPAAQTTGVAFSVAGTYVNGAPANLDSSIDGGATWQAVAAATIAGGNYSFNLTINAVNASQTVKVRDRATLVSATSGTFAVSAPAQAITVATPGPQTAGTAFPVNGTYVNGTPTGLSYSLNGGSTWTAATAPTIAGGNYSFNITIGAANAAQVVKVRDSATLATGTSGAFVVNAAAAVYAITGYNGNTVENVNMASASTYNGKKYVTPGVPFTDGFGYFNIKNSSNVDATGNVLGGWSRSNTTPPTTTLGGTQASPVQNTGVNAGNAFVVMGKPGAFQNMSFLWADAGANGDYFYWEQVPGDVAVCFNPNNPVVVSGA